MHEEPTEVTYLRGDFEQMERWATVVLQQAKTILNKVKVYEVKVAQAQLLEAVEIGLQVLELLGVRLPESPTRLDFQQALSATTASLRGQNIENDLINLPAMTDATQLAAIQKTLVLPCQWT
jgi:predicted ATPase